MAAKDEFGHECVYILELALDKCSNTWSVNNGTTSICNASGSPGTECYNTFPNCQDEANFDKANLAVNPNGPVTKQIYRFSNKRVDELQAVGDIVTFPTIISMDMAGTQLDRTKGIGIRSSVTVTLEDHPWSDRGTDPYVDNRTYDPDKQGSFWGKFINRNEFYEGRLMTLKTGYLNPDGSYDSANFTDERLYIIQRIAGPDANGNVTIEGKDPLKFADRNKAQYPPPPRALLSGDITDSATTFNYTDNGSNLKDWIDGVTTGEAQPYIRIDDEIIEVTNITTTQITALRATMPSIYQADTNIANSHDANASIQQCYYFNEIRVDDIYFFLLNKAARIPTTFLPLVDWQARINESGYQAYKFSRLLVEPKGVKDYLDELVKHNVYVFWDEREQLVKLGTLLPGEAANTTYDETNNIIQNSVTKTQDTKNRLTEVWLGYAHRNPILDIDKDNNLAEWSIKINLTAESIVQNDDVSIAKIRSPWLPRTLGPTASEIANRTLLERSRTKNVISITLDPKDDDQWVDDIVSVSTRLVQNADGSNASGSYLIKEADENTEPNGVTYSYMLEQATVFERVGVIAPDYNPESILEDEGDELEDEGDLVVDGTFPDYNDASDSLRSRYIFIAYDHAPDPPGDPLSPPGFNDGTPAYQIQ